MNYREFYKGFVDQNVYVYELAADGGKGELKTVIEPLECRVAESNQLPARVCIICGASFVPEAIMTRPKLCREKAAKYCQHRKKREKTSHNYTI
jgi:hypothetical protein